MKRGGIWIDHAIAYAVEFSGDGSAHVIRLVSEAPGRHKSKGGMIGASGQVSGASHTKAERRRTGQLHRFYVEVVDAVRDFAQLAILGPGMAKKEFEAVLHERARDVRVVAVVASDELTEPQIVARLRALLEIPVPQ